MGSSATSTQSRSEWRWLHALAIEGFLLTQCWLFVPLGEPLALACGVAAALLEGAYLLGILLLSGGEGMSSQRVEGDLQQRAEAAIESLYDRQGGRADQADLARAVLAIVPHPAPLSEQDREKLKEIADRCVDVAMGSGPPTHEEFNAFADALRDLAERGRGPDFEWEPGTEQDFDRAEELIREGKLPDDSAERGEGR